MKGKHWNAERNEPDDVLLSFLRDKASSVEKRIYSMTGVHARPIYYCAGYKEEDKPQFEAYKEGFGSLFFVSASNKKDKGALKTSHQKSHILIFNLIFL